MPFISNRLDVFYVLQGLWQFKRLLTLLLLIRTSNRYTIVLLLLFHILMSLFLLIDWMSWNMLKYFLKVICFLSVLVLYEQRFLFSYIMGITEFRHIICINQSNKIMKINIIVLKSGWINPCPFWWDPINEDNTSTFLPPLSSADLFRLLLMGRGNGRVALFYSLFELWLLLLLVSSLSSISYFFFFLIF